MNINKKIITTGIVVAIILGIGFVYSQKVEKTDMPQAFVENSVTTPSADTQDTSQSSVQVSVAGGGARDMWTAWTLYLDAAKRHDISELKNYAYALSDTCKDSKQEKACFEKMDAVYNLGSNFKKSDFSVQYEDAKQGILQTGLVKISSDTDFGYKKSAMIFVKDSSGNPKLISLKPNEEWKVKRNPASTTAELEKSLEEMVKDTDQDGLTDQIEKCIFPDNMLVVSCVESNPTKRDSDGDGYWDGVGFLIPKK